MATTTAAHVADVVQYIKKLVDEAPPLTPEQRDRLASLLRPVTSNGGGARAA